MNRWIICTCTLFCAGIPGRAQETGEAQVGGWRLADSPSAYLREHAENPVEWYPWGEEAFEQAKKLDRPIFLSIGYSSCHWCHVMRRESFSDPTIAAFMNENFISIKVDREDLPHVDDAYMDAVRAMTGGGGWPLSAFLLHDLKPFFGGTYFPPRARFNRPGFLELLGSIAKAWSEDRTQITDSAGKLNAHLLDRAKRSFDGIEAEGYLSGGLDGAASSYTADPAGFGKAPRFPNPRLLQYLIGEGKMRGDQASIDRGVSVLHAMANGGIYDQVGGGFHRYSVDAQWQVPHFEKMLYNQGSLAESYFEAGRIADDPQLTAVGVATCDALLEQFMLPDGGFAGSWDADSGGVEGSYYVWTPEQVKEVVGEESTPLICMVLGISEKGNFEGGEASVPRKAMSIEQAAKSLSVDLNQAVQKFVEGVALMKGHRAHRVAPKRDPKVVLGWNALAISALARGAALLDLPRFRQAAVGAYSSMKGSLVLEDQFQRRRDYPDGISSSDGGEQEMAQVSGNPATLQDAALWMKCCLDLYDATFEVQFVAEAIRSWRVILKEFGPLEADGGLFEAPAGAEVLLGRRQEFFDGAIPSGNATVARSLLRLYELTGSSEYRETGEHIIAAGLRSIGPYPTGSAELLLAVQAMTRAAPAVAVVGDPTAVETRSLIHAVTHSKVPFPIVALRLPGEKGSRAAEVVALLADRGLLDGKPCAYLCIHQQCDLPTSDVDALSLRLEEIARENDEKTPEEAVTPEKSDPSSEAVETKESNGSR